MGMSDWSNRITRLRQRGLINSYRQGDKDKKRSNVKPGVSEKFRAKRDAKILQLSRSNPNLTATQIAQRINSMPQPPGVAVSNVNTSRVYQLLRGAGLGRASVKKPKKGKAS
jgi:hypothetical protein